MKKNNIKEYNLNNFYMAKTYFHLADIGCQGTKAMIRF